MDKNHEPIRNYKPDVYVWIHGDNARRIRLEKETTGVDMAYIVNRDLGKYYAILDERKEREEKE